MESKGKKKSSGMLAPGFRFHPTDEELVRYYLRRKICRKAFRFDAISEIDIYKAEPWDLPSKSRLKSRDLEWYFFSVLDKKYGNGARTNRATEKGYWKTTGKDRAVYHRTEIVGMKKTLVYHSGRAPKGQRTNWVMHEYRLTDLELERVGIAQEAFVLCRVFQKSGSGPKNGEQYGAPFVEEEWEDDELEMDELEMVPKEEAAEEVDFADDIYLDSHDIEQILGSDFPSDTVPAALSVHSEVNSHGEETTDSVNNTQNFSVCADKQPSEPEQQDYNNFYNMPPSFDMDVKAVKHEYIGESSNSGNSEDLDYLLDEPFLDASDNLNYGDGGFIEANDLSNPIEADTSAFDMLEDYLTFFDTNDGDMQYLTYDSEVMPGSANPVSDQALLPQKELNEVTDQDTLPSGPFINKTNDDVALPSDKQELAKYESDFQHPFIKQASQMLGSIPAPPAFAAEFPSKDAVLRLNSSHVTAGMVQIRNLNVGGDGIDMAFGKDGNFNVVLSFGLARGDDGSTSLESSVSLLSGKTVSTITTISRSWFYFMFLWVLIISMSFKIGTYICSN